MTISPVQDDRPRQDLGADSTYADIHEQATTLAATAALAASARWAEELATATEVVFTGCGASAHAAAAAAALLSSLGHRSRAVPASEVWLSPDTYLAPGAALVALSRTGTTSEVVRAVQIAADRGLATVGVSLTTGTPVLDLADHALPLSHVQERGHVMTQSFSNLLLAAQHLAVRAAARAPQAPAAAASLDRAVQALPALLPGLDAVARQEALRGAEHYVYLGCGPLTPICAQGVLMMQEMTQLAGESHAGLEYRHGPIAALSPRSVMVVLASQHSAAFDALQAADAVTLGYEPVVIGDPAVLAGMPDTSRKVGLVDGLEPAAVGTLALPYLQLLAYHRTIGLGLDPETVRNLDRSQDVHINPHLVALTPDPVGQR